MIEQRSPANGGLLATVFVNILVLTVLSSAIYFGQGDVEDIDTSFQNPFRPAYIYIATYAYTLYLLYQVITGQATIVRNGFITIFLTLGVLHIGWLPFISSNEITDRTLVLRLNVCAMAICFQVIFSSLTRINSIIQAVRVVALSTCTLNTIVVLLPEFFDFRMGVFPGRAAGLYWDPNQCASFLAMMLPVININQNRTTRITQSSLILAGILFTFSREGIALWIVAVLLSEALDPGSPNYYRNQKLQNTLLPITGFIVAIATLSTFWAEFVEILHPFLTTDTYLRLKGTDEGSSSERMYVLGMGWEIFTSNPIFGAGFGATKTWGYSVSVHNMFVLILAEFGLVGFIWYLIFLVRIFLIPYGLGLTAGILVLLESLFTHSYFDLCYYVLLIFIYWRSADLLSARRPNLRQPVALDLR